MNMCRKFDESFPVNVKTTILVNDNGFLLLPLELNEYLKVKNGDWVQVKIKPEGIVIVPPQALDEETIRNLINSGILIDHD